MSTELKERADLQATDNDQKHTHIVSVDDWERGYMMGEEITALCGYKWVPTEDPNKYPACRPCLDRLEEEATS